MKRDKATITVEIPKPRNPVNSILVSKRGGAHRKTEKALRSKANNELKRALKTQRGLGFSSAAA